LTRYFDASALVKRYINEAGSKAVENLSASAVVFTSRLSQVEVASAVQRQTRDGVITEDARDAALSNFAEDWSNIRIIELTETVCGLAQSLIQRHALRAGDAVQLASALNATAGVETPLEFVGFDGRLSQAAKEEGFTVLP
jgi:predicted nucleic acid-binding protein